jgi:hypothetical protein
MPPDLERAGAEPGSDLLCLRRTHLRVEGERLLQVLTGLLLFAAAVVALGHRDLPRSMLLTARMLSPDQSASSCRDSPAAG